MLPVAAASTSNVSVNTSTGVDELEPVVSKPPTTKRPACGSVTMNWIQPEMKAPAVPSTKVNEFVS